MATLAARVTNIEGSVKNWIRRQLKVQDRRVQDRLDVFESRIIQQLGSGKMLDVTENLSRDYRYKGYGCCIVQENNGF